MASNVFDYLNKYGSPRDINALQYDGGKGLGLVWNKILQFPPGLGGELTGATPPKYTIPFTIFAPYKRNRGIEGLYSQQAGATLYTNLPAPWFAIALPTPTSALKSTYTATYAEVNIGQGLGTAIGGKSTAEAVKTIGGMATGAAAGGLIGGTVGAGVGAILGAGVADFFTGKKTLGDAGAVTGIGALQGGLSGIGSSPEVANLLSGAADNPYTESVFKNVGFRDHTFDYVFMPRNVKESETIDKIIQVFKYTMLPQQSEGLSVAGTSVSSGAGFFQFPYEFQITHSTQDTTFTLLPSVLSNLTVDYSGGADSPKFFVPQADKKQYPARITLSMTFKEMILLSRDRLDVPNGEQLFVKEGDADFRTGDKVLRFRF